MKTFQNKSMLARFSSGIGFSARKRDAKVTKEVARDKSAEEDSVDVFKRLLPKGALDAWQDAIAAARKTHDEMTLPWRDDGYRVLKSTKFTEYTDAMRKHRGLVEAEREAFAGRYPKYKEEAPARLGALFKEKDFPSLDKLLRKFKFKTDFLPVPAGDDFRVDLADEDLAEIRAQIDADARANLLKPLMPPLQHMVERLSEPEAVFRNTITTNIQDLLKLMPAGDPVVDALLARIKSELLVKPETLRESPSTRAATAAKANAILNAMAGYLSPEPGAAPVEPLPLPEPEPELAIVHSPQPTVHSPEPEPDPVPEIRPAQQEAAEETEKASPPLPPSAPVVLPPPAPTVPAWRRSLRSIARQANLL